MNPHDQLYIQANSISEEPSAWDVWMWAMLGMAAFFFILAFLGS